MDIYLVPHCREHQWLWLFSVLWFKTELSGLCFPPNDIKYKNIENNRAEIENLKKKKVSAILFSGELDMSARWNPTSNKEDFFLAFSFCWRWAWFKDEKSKIASKFWYIYGSFLSFFFSVSLLRLGQSLHREPPLYPSVRPWVWTCCVCRVLTSCSCFLLPVCEWAEPEWAWAVRRAGRDSHLAMYTFMVGPWLPTNSSTISAGRVHTPESENVHLTTSPQYIPHIGKDSSTYRSVWRTGSHFVSRCVPANLKDAPCSSVAVD